MKDVKVTMLLCDFAEAMNGKLYIMGGGWTVKGHMAPMALAVKLEIPWSHANEPHEWRLFLVDEDHTPVTVDTPDGAVPIQVSSPFEVGRPAGLRPGSSLDIPLAINIPSLALPPGQRFEWRLEIDGETREDWFVGFFTQEMT